MQNNKVNIARSHIDKLNDASAHSKVFVSHRNYWLDNIAPTLFGWFKIFKSSFISFCV